jgi:hypothetical protein
VDTKFLGLQIDKFHPRTKFLRFQIDQFHPRTKFIGLQIDKFHPRTGHEGPEGELRYSSTLSLTSALDGVVGQRHAPAALSPGKTRYPLYRRLDRPQSRSGGCGNSRPHRDSILGVSSP